MADSTEGELTRGSSNSSKRPRIESSKASTIGPTLPAHLAKPSTPHLSLSTASAPQRSTSIGPSLPPGFRRPGPSGTEKESHDSDASPVGPSLPPGFKKQTGPTRHAVVGPTLPPQFQPLDATATLQSQSNKEEEEDEDDTFGPMPAESTEETEVYDLANKLHMIEKRAKTAKRALTQPKTEVQQRGAWMTELPDLYRKNFGSGPREFRKKAATVDADVSAWTDTPADIERKKRERAERRAGASAAPKKTQYEPSQRDRMIEAKLSAYNSKHRNKSLMEMHIDKKEREKNDSTSGPAVRKRFDPETDLQLSRMKPMGKKELKTSTEALLGRFSSNSSARYL